MCVVVGLGVWEGVTVGSGGMVEGDGVAETAVICTTS